MDKKVKYTVNGKRIGRLPKTHCKHGHEFTTENTYIVQRGKYKGERRCRICIKARKGRQAEKERQIAQRKKDSWFF